jgi:peroxiredoxin
VTFRPRLLVGSLLVAAIASLAIGYAIAQSNNSSSSTGSPNSEVDDTGGGIPQPPSIETNAVVKGTPLPDVSIATLDGTTVELSSLVGQPLVINVWGSTCVPCRKELPDFAAAHLTYGDEVRFVGVSFLPPSDREENFARERGVQYELYYDATGEFVNEVGIAAFPVTLFVLADGTVVDQRGQLDEQQLVDIIESELL